MTLEHNKDEEYVDELRAIAEKALRDYSIVFRRLSEI